MSEATKSRKKNVRKQSSKEDQSAKGSKRSIEDETEDVSPNKKTCIDVKHAVLHTIQIEHCADELVAALKPAFSQLEFTFNPTKPRRGAFEFVAVSKEGKETVIWSGLKRGPPRKEKFPDSDHLAALFKKHFENKEKN